MVESRKDPHHAADQFGREGDTLNSKINVNKCVKSKVKLNKGRKMCGRIGKTVKVKPKSREIKKDAVGKKSDTNNSVWLSDLGIKCSGNVRCLSRCV